MTSPLDEELAEKWLPQATRKPIETRTITAKSQVNRLHILGPISIFACLRVAPFASKTGSSALLEGVNLPHLCIRKAREEQTPQRVIGTARGGWSCLKPTGK